MIAGSLLLAAGSGLISTWKIDTASATWIGYQILLGAGGGLGIQQAHTAAQTVLGIDDVPTGAVVIIFSQILGGAILISVAQNVFTNRLLFNLKKIVPGFDPMIAFATGATSLRSAVDAEFIAGVVLAYNLAVTQTFYASLALASLALIGAMGMEWRSIKDSKTDAHEDTELENRTTVEAT